MDAYTVLLFKLSYVRGTVFGLLSLFKFFIKELAKRGPLAAWYASFWPADSCLVKIIPH